MRLSSALRKAAVGAAAISLLTACVGGGAPGAGAAGEKPGGAAESGAGPSERPAAWTDLPVRAGTRDAVHKDTDQRVYQVRITVESLVRGSAEDMRGAQVDEELKGTVPHYVGYQVTNTSRKQIPASYMVGSGFALNATDWTRGEEIRISGGRPGGGDLPCSDTAPKTLPPGASFRSCAAFTLPAGVGVLSVTHHTDGTFATGGPIASWPVEGGVRAASAGLAGPGETLLVRWRDIDRGVLELPATPVSVRRGDPADLAGLDLGLDPHERRGVPYYVLIRYTNPGPGKLYPSQAGDVRLLTEGGRQIAGKTPFLFRGKIPGCPSDWVARLVPAGGDVTQCSIHMLPDDGDKPLAVGFAEADRTGLVTWRAPLR
ncbi:hypothetical protein [Streptomyces sp. NPDC048659]|uniref:hypothetical protein n=1 Tax=Streptomyces sp. NPDC048659 TaxID=3155489 RepID=UPI00343D4F83